MKYHAAFVLSLLCVAQHTVGQVPSRPNIVFLQTDSMDGRVLDPTDRLWSVVEMPNLRRLAQRGVNFVRTYSNSPQCVPSRSSMWTGRHVHEVKTWNNDQGLCRTYVGYRCVDQNVTGLYPLMIDPLAAGGYTTALIGKTDFGAGYGGGFHGDLAGFTAWTRGANVSLPQTPGPELNDTDPEPNAADVMTAEQCVQWLQANASKSQPFMLYCSILVPHNPYDTNSTWLSTVNDSAVTLPPWVPFEQMHGYDQFMTVAKCDLEDDCTGRNATDDEILRLRKAWFAMCAQSDALVGRVIDAAAAAAGSTYIIFTSDHGELNQEHRQWNHNAMYEGSTRVPLIIVGPGIESGRVVANLTSLLDIFPTVVDLTNTSPPPGLQGTTLLPFLMPNGTIQTPHPDHIIVQYHSNYANTGTYMIRQGDWKYVVFGQNPPYGQYEPMLFNLATDPDEMLNLYSARPDVAASLDELLQAEVGYNVIEKSVKQQDVDMYKAYAAINDVDEMWAQAYIGFQDSDKSRVETWLQQWS